MPSKKLVPCPPSAMSILGVLALSLLGAAQPAAAEFPDRPITLVVAYAPGGGTDAIGRLLGRELTRIMGQSVVVDNRPGAGATIGAGIVQRAAPDGYTLLVADPAFVINSRLMEKVSYDLKKDFTPVATLTMSPLVLTVHPGVQASNIEQLVALSLKTPNGLSFSSAGIGTTPHMAGELLKYRTKANFTHIPYKGSGPAMANLAGGQLDFAFATIPAAKTFTTSKRLIPLATSGLTRSPEFPDVPTVAETIPGFNILFWTALFAPAHTPPAIVKKLNDAIAEAYAMDEFRTALQKNGETPSYLPAAKVDGFVDDELRKYSGLITEASIKPE